MHLDNGDFNVYDWCDETGKYYYKLSKEELKEHEKEVLAFMHSNPLEPLSDLDHNEEEILLDPLTAAVSTQVMGTPSEMSSDVDRTDSEIGLNWSSDARNQSSPAVSVGSQLTTIYEVKVLFTSDSFLIHSFRSVNLAK